MNPEANNPVHGSPNGPGPHQRGERRHPSFASAGCQVLNPVTGEWLPAGIRDVSSWGACLLLSERFETGQVLTLKLSRPERGLRRTIHIRVCHAEIACPNDTWLHGCEFAEALDADEVQALL